VPFFSATGDEPVLAAVGERIDPLLMEVEGLAVFVLELVDVVNVDEAV